MVTGTLKKWGNSQGITIPKSYCEHLDIKPGDKINLSLADERILVEPVKEFTLASLIEEYEAQTPLEYDWGKPMGKEMW